MIDMESYVAHCYDLLLQEGKKPGAKDNEELCDCAALVKHQDHQDHPSE